MRTLRYKEVNLPKVTQPLRGKTYAAWAEVSMLCAASHDSIISFNPCNNLVGTSVILILQMWTQKQNV